MQQPLIQLGYISKAIRLMGDAQLDHLLIKARERNEQKAITGMLLYADGSFLQMLEGPPSNVHEIFSMIQADPRHEDISTLFEKDIPSRDFINWTMGFRRLQSDEITKAPGMNHFLQGEESLGNFFAEQTKPDSLLQSMLTYFKQAA